jgi:hypothetical protein
MNGGWSEVLGVRSDNRAQLAIKQAKFWGHNAFSAMGQAQIRTAG